MHYKGLLRVARREAGIRIYALQRHGPPPQSAALRRARLDALVDVVVRKYPPIPSVSLSFLLRRLSYAVPQWRGEISGALERARHRLSRASVDGETWIGRRGSQRGSIPRRTPCGCSLRSIRSSGTAGASNGFGDGLSLRGYTPVAKRKLGYYALPLLWRDHVVGWANLALRTGQLHAEFGLCRRREARRARVCARTRRGSSSGCGSSSSQERGVGRQSAPQRLRSDQRRRPMRRNVARQQRNGEHQHGHRDERGSVQGADTEEQGFQHTVIPNASENAATTPRSATRPPCSTTIRRTAAASAPSAMRTAISRVRCETTYDRTP